MKSKHFTTSDGTEFYTETNALNHARTLEDKTVTPPSVVAENIEVNDEEIETGEGSEGTGTEGKEGSGEDPKKVNFSRFSKAQLIAFAVENELTIDETATNPVIVASIEAQLTEKNQA